MRFTAIIQARLGSTRLPKKILTDIEGRSALEWQIVRLKESKLLSEVVIATTSKSEDDAVAQFANDRALRFFRGSEDDVLSRYVDCVAELNLKDGLVRLTSDCPLIDPDVLDSTIQKYLEDRAEYASNVLERTFPRGLDVEVFNVESLKKANTLTQDMAWREHVTPAFYKTSHFKTTNYKATVDHSDLRLTLDTPEDLDLIRQLFQRLLPKYGENFKLADVVAVFENEPELKKINASILQKAIK